MNKEIKEALEWLRSGISFMEKTIKGNWAVLRTELSILYTIRTALESYGKPKTVKREWVGDFIYGTYARLSRNDQEAAEEYALGLLKDEDIEVEGDK